MRDLPIPGSPPAAPPAPGRSWRRSIPSSEGRILPGDRRRGETGRMGGLEAAQGLVRVHHPPRVDRAGDALQCDGPRSTHTNRSPTKRRVSAVITTAFGSAEACRRAATFRVSPISPSSSPGRPPENRPRSPTPSRFPPEPTTRCSQRRAAPAEAALGLHDAKARTHSPLRVVFVRHRIAEVGENAVTEILSDATTKVLDDRGGSGQIAPDEPPEVLRIQLAGDRRGPDEIGEKDGHASALGRPRFRECCARSPQPWAPADRRG